MSPGSLPKMLALAAILTLSGCSAGSVEQASQPTEVNKGSATRTVDTSSPESALISFMYAVLTGDSDMLTAASMPHDELDLLLTGDRPPHRVYEQALASIENMKMKRMKVGDKIALPSGRELVMDESHVNDQRQQLLPDGESFPFDLSLDNGNWRVNPYTPITLRKAADRLKKERQ